MPHARPPAPLPAHPGAGRDERVEGSKKGAPTGAPSKSHQRKSPQPAIAISGTRVVTRHASGWASRARTSLLFSW